MIGKAVSHYKILEKLGGGGMGVVYKAKDERLGREVALKFLPAHLSEDEEAKQRFIAEAKAASALDHPNICTIYEIDETDDDQMFIAMAYYEGETLKKRMEREPLSILKAIKIAVQIAQGLAQAHKNGIVHRDIKPANVIITRDGLVKIVDFGLAKITDVHITRTGWTLGTAAYMSPEQARGENVDHQTDIWSLGVIFYEMITRRYPFKGENSQSIIYSILNDEPDSPSTLQNDIPTPLDTIMLRCLEKEKEKRFQSAEEVDLGLESVLQEISGQVSSGMSVLGTAPSPRSKRKTLLWPIIAITILLIVFIGYQIVQIKKRPVEIKIGRTNQITHDPSLEIDPAISPDGKMLAYSVGDEGDMNIYVRQLSGGRAITLTQDVTEDSRWPRWSPDGSQIAFHSSGTVYIVPTLGGAPRQLIRGARGASHAWQPGGKKMAFAEINGIYIQSVYGEESTEITEIYDPHSLCFSPDGALLAYVAGNSNFIFSNAIGNIAPSSIWVISVQGGEPIRIRESKYLNMSPVWTPDGKHLLFISDQDGSRDVYHIPMDATGKPSGEAMRLTTGLGAHTINLSRDGTSLVYSKFTHRSNIWSIPISTGGPISISRAQPVTAGNQVIEGMRVSWDGQWLVFDSNRSGNQDVYKQRLTGGEPIQLTTHSSNDYYPAWSPDGKAIAFYSLREGNRDIFVMSEEGGSIRQITQDSSDDIEPDWSPDGQHLVFFSYRTGDVEIFVVSKNEEQSKWGVPRQLTSNGGQHAKWSPNGDLIAFLEAAKLLVISPDNGDARVIFSDSDREKYPWPLFLAWSPDGQTIYYKAFDKKWNANIWSVPVSGGTPKHLVIFDDPFRNSRRTEFTTDGQKFFFTLAENESDIWMMELIRDR